MASVFRTEEKLRGVIEDVRIVRRKYDGHGAGVAIFLHGSVVAVKIERRMLNVVCLVRAAIEHGDIAEVGASVNDVRIARVNGNVAALATAPGVPIRAVDVATVAGGSAHDGRIVLLRAIDPDWEIVRGGHVAKQRRRRKSMKGHIFSALVRVSG